MSPGTSKATAATSDTTAAAEDARDAVPGGGIVAVSAEERLRRTPDGAVWTNGTPGYPLWHRYLTIFDQVRVLARVVDVPSPPPGGDRVDGPGVHVWPLPYYVGPGQYLSRLIPLRRALWAGVRDVETVIVRVPSPIAVVLTGILRRAGRRYAAEVVGDPHDVLAPGVIRHPLRPLLRRWATNTMRRQCRHATAVSYVTARFLQSRYPAAPHAPTSWYSSRELKDDDFAPTSHRPPAPGAQLALVSVGSLHQMYKGIDVLLEAMRLLAEDGLTPRLVHVGDGRYRAALARQAARAGLAERVAFVGTVPAASVAQHLDAADVFVHPSRTEGLPRVVIEAMARGLPVIGTAVGGIPELLDEEWLVPPGAPDALAAAIRRLARNPDKMHATAARNLTRARDFHREVQAARRTAFYRHLRYG